MHIAAVEALYNHLFRLVRQLRDGLDEKQKNLTILLKLVALIYKMRSL